MTFLENHDTGSSQGHWRFPHHALEQGYAYLLTHPGTPSVFYDHFFHEKQLSHTIRRLMDLRRRNRIHCRSTVRRRPPAADPPRGPLPCRRPAAHGVACLRLTRGRRARPVLSCRTAGQDPVR